ncbi:hypothetical protein BC830DRAFT_151901 [Chytriomyces sp. MP71]|nr:hypothetical protein BC830DRAFT_151901 [Chytriomyces sp. MP71]
MTRDLCATLLPFRGGALPLRSDFIFFAQCATPKAHSVRWTCSSQPTRRARSKQRAARPPNHENQRNQRRRPSGKPPISIAVSWVRTGLGDAGAPRKDRQSTPS